MSIKYIDFYLATIHLVTEEWGVWENTSGDYNCIVHRCYPFQDHIENSLSWKNMERKNGYGDKCPICKTLIPSDINKKLHTLKAFLDV